MIKFACPVCSRKYSVSEDKAGKRTACVECKKPLVVPQPTEGDDCEPLPDDAEVVQSPPPPLSAPTKSTSLVPCKDCGANVSRKAMACPHCGVSKPGASTGKLHLIRSSSMTGGMHVVRVSVDGEFMGEVKGGATLTLDVAAGARVVEVSGGGLSRTVIVQVEDGKTARYEMSFSNWGALGGGLNLNPVGASQLQTPSDATSTTPPNKQKKLRWIELGICVSGIAIVLVVLFATSNKHSSDEGTSPGPVQTIRASTAWPPELVAELKKAEETAHYLVAEDQKMRETLPRLAREAKDALTTPKTNIQRKFEELDIDREFEAKRIAWKEKMIEMQARLAGGLIALVRKYGPEDKKLADEYARIIQILKPIAAPWPALP
ncbi:MAG: hypothetical protein C0467_15985 [Planctomycetaceae bacterium]|nr:hypothetical protein [Planctomycetaceae bacterium]